MVQAGNVSRNFMLDNNMELSLNCGRGCWIVNCACWSVVWYYIGSACVGCWHLWYRSLFHLVLFLIEVMIILDLEGGEVAMVY